MSSNKRWKILDKNPMKQRKWSFGLKCAVRFRDMKHGEANRSCEESLALWTLWRFFWWSFVLG